MTEFYVRPESVSFVCPYCTRTIRLAERGEARQITPRGAKHVQYAHGRCIPRLTVIQGGLSAGENHRP